MHLNLFPKKPELLFNTLTNQTILVQNLRTGPNKNLKPKTLSADQEGSCKKASCASQPQTRNFKQKKPQTRNPKLNNPNPLMRQPTSNPKPKTSN
jgi:hypothetical protein